MCRIVILGGTDPFTAELKNHFRREKFLYFPFGTMPNDQAIKNAHAIFVQGNAVKHKVTKKMYALRRVDRSCIHYFSSKSANSAIEQLEAFLAAAS